jgi:CDP-glucose 4,6-dehydratase
LLEENKDFAENWNFGPNDSASLTVQEVIEHTRKHWEKIVYDIQENPADFHEANLLKLDSSKARTVLKWTTVWDNDTTFKKTIDWYKNYYADGSLQSIADLESYVADAEKQSIEWAVV